MRHALYPIKSKAVAEAELRRCCEMGAGDSCGRHNLERITRGRHYASPLCGNIVRHFRQRLRQAELTRRDARRDCRCRTSACRSRRHHQIARCHDVTGMVDKGLGERSSSAWKPLMLVSKLLIAELPHGSVKNSTARALAHPGEQACERAVKAKGHRC